MIWFEGVGMLITYYFTIWGGVAHNHLSQWIGFFQAIATNVTKFIESLSLSLHNLHNQRGCTKNDKEK